MTSENDFPNPFGTTHFGFFKKVNREGNASPSNSALRKGWNIISKDLFRKKNQKTAGIDIDTTS